MRSFRLYVGERSYLTAAGWASLAVAVGVTAGVGYFGAKPLTELLGPAWVSRAVAGCGFGSWLLALGLFRLAGFPQIDRLPDDEPQPAP